MLGVLKVRQTGQRLLPIRGLGLAVQATEGAALLPCHAATAAPGGAAPGAVYDLHAAHTAAGATADAGTAFVPLEWRAFNPHIAQIPGTFPVRTIGRSSVISSVRRGSKAHNSLC